MTEADPEGQPVDLIDLTDEADPAVDRAGVHDEVDGVHDEPVGQDHEPEERDHADHAEHSERAATQLSVLPTPVPGPTGVPGVDAALDRLAELSDLDGDPEQHVAVLEDVQDRLQAALSGPDESAP